MLRGCTNQNSQRWTENRYVPELNNSMLKLYTYYRSSSAYRVRIALALKELDYVSIPIHLVKDGGQHRQSDYLAKNPAGLVPALGIEQGVLAQSLSIIEYLDECYPQLPLLPQDPVQRARVRAFAHSIACDMQPLNNLRVINYLKQQLGATAEASKAWYQHWAAEGFTALEAVLSQQTDATNFCFGDTPSMADCLLIPQVYNAVRFDCPLDDYPNIRRIDEHCRGLPAFRNAAPENQQDAE